MKGEHGVILKHAGEYFGLRGRASRSPHEQDVWSSICLPRPRRLGFWRASGLLAGLLLEEQR